jgi:tRNA threonylcarbamoyladenosine biosynthesis protein TsaB
MYILCIETTTTNCSVALASERGGFTNGFNIKYCCDLVEDQSDNYSHGERLHLFINKILSNNELVVSELDAIAISCGPGSYTGLRIGVSTAKGLCYALDIPLISIDTLTALSLQNVSKNPCTIAFLDARRMEVYSAVFENGECMEQPVPTILKEDSFEPYLKKSNAVVIGTGVRKFEEITSYTENEFMTSNPTALTMCDLAIAKMKTSDTVTDIAYFEPFYLKEFKS